MKAEEHPKTVRFAKLVEQSGKPELLALWVDPEHDPRIKHARAGNRILTVKQLNVGTRKDYGQIGFFPEKQAAYFVFPKALSCAPGAKVVGIKYDAAEKPAIHAGAVAVTPKHILRANAATRSHRPKPAPAEKIAQKKSMAVAAGRPHTYEVRLRRRSTKEWTIEVEAKTQKDAKRMALAEAGKTPQAADEKTDLDVLAVKPESA